MVISKSELLKSTTHFIEIDDVIHIPDYVIKHKLVDKKLRQEFVNVDCIFYHELVSDSGSVYLKPIAIESFDSVSYLKLLEGNYRPKFVYIFNKGILDIDLVSTTILHE